MTSLLTTETSLSVPTAFPVPTTTEAPTAFADVVNAFFRNKRKIVIAAVSFLLLVLAIFILRPKQYEAHMMFMVRNEASTFPISSFDDRPQMQQPEQAMTDVQIGTEIELLKGNELHRQVISAMHPGLSSSQLDRQALDVQQRAHRATGSQNDVDRGHLFSHVKRRGGRNFDHPK